MGSGKEVARGLARDGHSVALVGRDGEKGTQAAQEIRETTGNAKVQFLRADLSPLRLLLDEDLEGVTGALFLKIKKLKRLTPSAGVRDPEEGTRLWEQSERLTAKALAPAAVAAQ
jgi:short-subunit dehydrogenase